MVFVGVKASKEEGHKCKSCSFSPLLVCVCAQFCSLGRTEERHSAVSACLQGMMCSLARCRFIVHSLVLLHGHSLSLRFYSPLSLPSSTHSPAVEAPAEEDARAVSRPGHHASWVTPLFFTLITSQPPSLPAPLYQAAFLKCVSLKRTGWLITRGGGYGKKTWRIIQIRC